MASYLELEELSPGKEYICEMYTGITAKLKYLGDGEFASIEGETPPPGYESEMSVYGDVRFVQEFELIPGA